MLGAVIGIEKPLFPQHSKGLKQSMQPFYSELKDLRISIVPKQPTFQIEKSMYTETTGMYNKESTFLMEYEELINPCWDIYIDGSKCDKYSEIKEMLIKGYSKFDTFLGKNHFFANITDVEILEGEHVTLNNIGYINSLYAKSDIVPQVDNDSDDDKDDEYYFEEFMPIEYNDLGQYDEIMVYYTNKQLESASNVELIKSDYRNLFFF